MYKGDAGKAESLMNNFARKLSLKDGEAICSLMFPADEVDKMGSVYFLGIEMDVTNANLRYKEITGAGLFDDADYEFKNIKLTDYDNDDIERIQSYYNNNFGVEIKVDKGFSGIGTLNFNDKDLYDIQFDIIKVDNEWYVGANIWDLLFCKLDAYK